LSREAYPKQFLALTGEYTLLQATLRRLDGLPEEHPHQGIGMLPPLVVCNEAHRFLVAEQMQAIEQRPASIILEPVGRNTAPALTLAALATQDNPVLLAMPADHLIRDDKAFRRVVARGLELAGGGAVVTFGIVPGGPETGYGYIQKGSGRGGSCDAFLLQGFAEKPDQATAEAYVASGEYLWNSGIFMLRASLWLRLAERYRPDIAAACRQAAQAPRPDVDFCRPDAEAFRMCPADSIDYAVMERLASDPDVGVEALVLPLDAGWSDVGAWSSLWEVSERDGAGNVASGDVVLHDTRDSLAIAQHRMLAAVGVENLVIVETPDAVLVLDKSRAQDVKAIIEYLNRQGREEGRFHQRMHRPWGAYCPIDQGERYQVKRLSVKPGASLSLQMHHHRAEHWVVVKGTAKVTRGEEEFLLTENQSTFIPLGCKHRLENPGSIPLEIIEVQSGSYLGEDDIIRFEDRYQRVSEG
jgi:mannose-1-phosphate guanylyltransferase/mannose-6-phosphate isomerase